MVIFEYLKIVFLGLLSKINFNFRVLTPTKMCIKSEPKSANIGLQIWCFLCFGADVAD